MQSDFCAGESAKDSTPPSESLILSLAAVRLPGWIPVAYTQGQSGSRKGVSENGKSYLPSTSDGKEAWAKERQGSRLQALFAQADQQEVQLIS